MFSPSSLLACRLIVYFGKTLDICHIDRCVYTVFVFVFIPFPRFGSIYVLFYLSFCSIAVLLMLASQRIESDIFGANTPVNVGANLSKRFANMTCFLLLCALHAHVRSRYLPPSCFVCLWTIDSRRGVLPSFIELCILAYVFGKTNANIFLCLLNVYNKMFFCVFQV